MERRRWGLSLGDLTPDMRNEVQAEPAVHGAVVEEVKPGSPADNAGLQRGDVIMEVNRHPVKSAADVAQALSGVPNGQDALVLVVVARGQHIPRAASFAGLREPK